MQDFFDNAEPRVVALMLAGVVLLVALVEVTYLLWPQVRQYRALSASHATLQQAVTSSDSLEAQLGKIDAEVQTLSRRLHGDMARLPAKQMESFIIGRLQTISWRNDVTLVAVEPAAGESVEMYREVLFRVELVGDYTALLRWLEDVATELGFVVIKEYQLNVAEDHPDNPPLKTRLLLAAYRVTDG